MRHYPQKVENYTNAFLITAGLTLFMAFFTLAALKGIVWVILSAALIDAVIRAGDTRLRASEVREDS
ncbi:hypothetical protein [Octadecabacter dasysiphoniae]|nr:hypothetical protein [Octadecabacter dasysiphoniae]